MQVWTKRHYYDINQSYESIIPKPITLWIIYYWQKLVEDKARKEMFNTTKCAEMPILFELIPQEAILHIIPKVSLLPPFTLRLLLFY